jgi:high-mobility group nucleosome-binding domain-containing protein 2
VVAEPEIRRVGPRRVRTDAVPGTEPNPQLVDGDDKENSRGGDANDDRLKQDKPPHWG